MQAFVLNPADAAQLAKAPGAIIAEEVTIGRKRAFHKGHRIVPSDLDQLGAAPEPLHAVRLAESDIHEDEAATRLAAAIAGPGLERTEPRQSRINLSAAIKGLLRVDADAVISLNLVPDVAVFTLYDRLAVVPGQVVAGAKITPIAIDRSALERAEGIAALTTVVQVKPFLPLKVGVVTTEGMAPRVKERFRANLTNKIGWYGGSVLGFVEVEPDSAQVAQAIARFKSAGADLILTGGGTTVDPLDPAIQALPKVGAELVKFGAPSHPGSMFWIAYQHETPIFNLASCSMYSGSTSADLILPSVMAGERVTERDMAALGYGGLLEGGEMSFRFPPYNES